MVELKPRRQVSIAFAIVKAIVSQYPGFSLPIYVFREKRNFLNVSSKFEGIKKKERPNLIQSLGIYVATEYL